MKQPLKIALCWLAVVCLLTSCTAAPFETPATTTAATTTTTVMVSTVQTETTTAATTGVTSARPTTTTTRVTTVKTRDPIAVQLAAMSLKERVGQLFFVRPEALNVQNSAEVNDNALKAVTTVTAQMKETYRQYPVGGFVLFTNNITDPAQLTAFTTALHSLGDIRPLLCIDEEGGKITRIALNPAFSVPTFDTMLSLAESGDPQKGYEVGNAIGHYLKTYGFDIDFAPVADVNTNPDNPVIGVRAFGSDPVTAGKFVSRVVAGLHAAGIKSCLKHYPGHGDTATDTHTGYAETNKTWEQIKACEWLPFKAGIAAGSDLIMVAHIACPKVTGSSIPASLSSVLLTDKLRGELHYTGVIVTDALGMGAIAKEYPSGKAALASFKAGADILLMPQNFRDAFDAVLAAVKNGSISEKRLNESVYRILKLKA